MNKTKIAIIGCYYGEFPVWIQYWLKSCSTNKTIDFYIVTDIQMDNLPDNVKIISLTLKEVKELAEKKLEINVNLTKPYKLCDFKPCYGLVFEEYIRGYDYWGHCDFDLIWGDIRGFISKYEIDKYDKFLPFGHLSLYRNTKEVNMRYMLDGSQCGDYREVFSDDGGHAFDETGGIYSIYQKHGFPMFNKRIFAEIKTFHDRFRLKQVDKNYKHQVFYFKNGKVMRSFEECGSIKQQEFIYIHFRRKLPADKRKWSELTDFYITNKGFVDMYDVPTNVKEIEKYNHNPGAAVELFETVGFMIKNIRKVKSKIQNEILSVKQRI